ncbi:hypothetical protein CMK11_09640 [Candidatus Poribacteria bacterium]|nr:hypothetical protein [Candidatus Poribacteria bacterium]
MAIAHQELTATHEPDWVRIRLAYAARDADAGRLDGVIGHYRELCEALRVSSDMPVEKGLRMMAQVLGRSGRHDLAKQADRIADRFLGALVGAGTRSRPTPSKMPLEVAVAQA